MPKKVKILPTPNLKMPISPELVGKAVQAKRTQSQLRLEDAAALCGVAKQTLMKIEHGYPNTQLATVLQVCASLGLSITILPWQVEEEVDNEWQ